MDVPPTDRPPAGAPPGRPDGDAQPEDLDYAAPGRHAAGSSQLGRSPRPPRTREQRTAAREARRRALRRRRLIALGVLVAAVVLLVVVVVLVARACGGAPTGASGAASPAPSPAALRTPTAAEPLRLAAYGDSVGGGALLGLKLLTADRKDIKVHRFVKVATGLARPDYFDWPAYLEKDMARRKAPFEAVFVMLGANDGQNVVAGGKSLKFGTAAWKKMYAKRVGEVMDFYLKNGVKKVYWAGMPRMGIGWFNKRMAVLDGIYEAEVAKRAPRVEYVDAWKAVDAPKTTYRAALRQEDGVHLSVDGGLKVAREALDAVARDWHLPAFEE